MENNCFLNKHLHLLEKLFFLQDPLNSQSFFRKPFWSKILFWVLLLFCFTPYCSPPLALFLGIVLAQFTVPPYENNIHRATQLLLKAAVVGLGFGMNASTALSVGSEGMVFAIATITGTLLLGYILGKIIKIDYKTSFLIASGTAICGGSAIAAVSPVINANEKQISVSLGTIFVLNAVALFVFPVIGSALQLTQSQFGFWCAIAIQDTSSVVGAASKYGNEALQIATTVKLARALWIIPLALISSWVFRAGRGAVKIPYFIGGFVLAILVNTYVPAIQPLAGSIVFISKLVLTATLFLIGCKLSGKTIVAVGYKPILQGLLLWIAISCISLLSIYYK